MEMMARHLDYGPKTPKDALATVSVMEADLRRLGFKDEDAERVAKTFDFLGPRIQKWPTVAMLKENMQRRDNYHLQDKMEPVPRERAMQILERLRKVHGLGPFRPAGTKDRWR